MSPSLAAVRSATARYLPFRSLMFIPKGPSALDITSVTTAHVPLARFLWILTGILWVHWERPVVPTVPVARR